MGIDAKLELRQNIAMLTPKQIVKMAEALREHGYDVKPKGDGRGRIPVPTPCAKCGTICPSHRESRMHCPKRSYKPRASKKVELEQICY